MPVIERSVTTGLPAAVVFDYVADFENIAEWDPGVLAARKVGDGPLAVGTVFDLDLRYGRRRLQMSYEVITMERPNLIVLRGDGSRSVAVDRIECIAEPGGTRVEYRAEIRLRGLLRLAEPFLGGLFASIGDGARDGLARRLSVLEGTPR